ncbi:hypothetical protein KS4_09170 [Poriferisphaera corsica]|uniref:Uncharacterized protein n=1 Tax=Poriferisphaera corsica TaxID=2528020 RepID=A0A517YRN3_9BACT|nr:hypothetical protein KS4_09170 [Poriferisphaera corsica]
MFGRVVVEAEFELWVLGGELLGECCFEQVMRGIDDEDDLMEILCVLFGKEFEVEGEEIEERGIDAKDEGVAGGWVGEWIPVGNLAELVAGGVNTRSEVGNRGG